jgi:hypothetical protein
MIPRLQAAEYVSGHAIRLRFADGTEGVVDLKDELWGEVFEPLRDPATFRNFQLDPELNTVTWPTGADLAPEFLYEKAAAQQADAAGRPPAGR